MEVRDGRRESRYTVYTPVEVHDDELPGVPEESLDSPDSLGERIEPHKVVDWTPGRPDCSAHMWAAETLSSFQVRFTYAQEALKAVIM